jgi:hypothetical protein
MGANNQHSKLRIKPLGTTTKRGHRAAQKGDILLYYSSIRLYRKQFETPTRIISNAQ